MSLEVAIDLVVSGCLLVGFSLLAQYVKADFPRLTFTTGVVGGGLCILWGILGRRGIRCRMAAMATLAAVACVTVRQAVLLWAASINGESWNQNLLLIMIVILVFSIGMLANLIQEKKLP